MVDKNGVEMKTGDIVRVSGAYFKNDNGLWFIERSPGDPSWCGGVLLRSGAAAMKRTRRSRMA